MNVDEKKWLYTYGAFTSICVLICIFHLIKRTVYPVLGIPGIFFPSGGVLHPATFICRHRNVSKSPIYTWFVNICEITDYEKPRIAQCTCMRTGQTVLTEGRRWRIWCICIALIVYVVPFDVHFSLYWQCVYLHSATAAQNERNEARIWYTRTQTSTLTNSREPSRDHRTFIYR